MISLRPPSPETIRAFLASQSKLGFTYSEVGATAGVTPPGYNVDHTRITVGNGEKVFAACKLALERWEHFRLGWVEAYYPATTIHVDEVVAVVGRSVGLWGLNACRIVYVVDQDGPLRKFGFAYGTLPGHVEIGEERFLIEWNRDNSVSYDILAFSRPHGFVARLGNLWLRRMQERFRRDSAAAMIRAADGAR